MRKYLYDTHTHTSEVSACATATGASQARIYKRLGYDGIVVTNHFYHGNTTVPRDLPWKEWVNRFCIGYENTKAEGDKLGLSVFFGWEESFEGNDILVYGMDKQWLLEHPQVIYWGVEDLYKHIKEDGGYVVHAHPFREANYIKKIRLFPKDVDAVEIINSSHKNLKFDKRAQAYAANYKLPITAGSDSHHVKDIRGGILLNKKLDNIQDFIKTMKSGEEPEVVRDSRNLSIDYKQASSGRGK